MENEHIILFGAGKIGKEALDVIGSDYVYAFCDNSVKNGECTEKYGKNVISLDEYCASHSDKILVITASLTSTVQIEEQCQNKGIYDYFVYDDLGYYGFSHYGADKFIEIFKDKASRLFRMKQIARDYLKKYGEVRKFSAINVEFYLVESFEIEHFILLYNILNEKGINAYFVAEPKSIHVDGDYLDYERAIKILKEKNLKYHTMRDAYADIAFTTQAVRNLARYSKKTIKINLQYGCSLLKNAFGASEEGTAGFDYKMSNGQFDRELCCRYIDSDRAYDIGYPKYYDIAGTHMTREQVREELGIKTQKKIIAYLPTWDENSSIQVYYNELKSLKDKYYIVTKPHHCTYRLDSKKDDLNKLYEISDMVLQPEYGLDKFMFIGDLTVIDAKSGATLEATFLNDDMKMVWLLVSKDVRNLFWQEINNIVELVDNRDDLVDVVNKTMAEDDYIEYRKEHINQYFSKYDRKYLENVLMRIISANNLL